MYREKKKSIYQRMATDGFHCGKHLFNSVNKSLFTNQNLDNKKYMLSDAGAPVLQI